MVKRPDPDLNRGIACAKQVLQTPTPGIEPGKPEGNTLSKRAEYHCPMWAYWNRENKTFKDSCK